MIPDQTRRTANIQGPPGPPGTSGPQGPAGPVNYNPTLDSSGGVSVGDAVGVAPGASPLVKRATSGIPAHGIATGAASSGGTPPTQVFGIVPTSVTGLGEGAEANAVVDPSSGRIVRKAALDGSEIHVGVVDVDGKVTLGHSKTIGTSPRHVVNLAAYCALDGVNPDDDGVAAAIAVASANGFPIELPAGKTLIVTRPIEINSDSAHGNVVSLHFFGGRGGSLYALSTILWAGASLTGSAATIASVAQGDRYLVTGLTGITSANLGDVLEMWNTANPMNSGHFCIVGVPTAGQAYVQNFASAATVADANNGSIKWRQRGNAFRLWTRSCVIEDIMVRVQSGHFLGAAFDVTKSYGSGSSACSANVFRNVTVTGNWNDQRISYGWVIGRANDNHPDTNPDPSNCENMVFDGCFTEMLGDTGLFVPNATGNSQNHRWNGGTQGTSIYGTRIRNGSIKGEGLAWEVVGCCFSWMAGGAPCSFNNTYNEGSGQLFSRLPITGGSGTTAMVSFQGGQLSCPLPENLSPVTRANSTAYTAGTFLTPAAPNGYAYLVKESGTSGSSPPTFPTTLGGCVTDGTATLQCFIADRSQPYTFVDYESAGALSIADCTFGFGSFDDNFRINANVYADIEITNCTFPNAQPFRSSTPQRCEVSRCTGFLATWAPTTVHYVGDVVVSSGYNGYRYRCTGVTTGISGGSDTLNAVTTIGASVTDGGLSWICDGRAVNNFTTLPESTATYYPNIVKDLSQVQVLTRVASWSVSAGAASTMPSSYQSAETVLVGSDPGQTCTISIVPHSHESKEIVNGTSPARLLIVQAQGGTKRTAVPPGRAVRFRCDGVDFWPVDRPDWSPISPDQILGTALCAYYRADTTLNTPGSAQALAGWADLSGNGNNLAMATGANQPRMRGDVHGRQGVQFRSSANSTMDSGAVVAGAPAYTAAISTFLITRIDSLGSYYIATCGQRSSPYTTFGFSASASDIGVMVGTGFYSVGLPLAATLGQPALWEAHFAGNAAAGATRLAIALNGQQAYDVSGASAQANGTYTDIVLNSNVPLSGGGPGQPANQTICEYGVINRLMTDEERARLRVYAQYAYGIEVTL